MLLCRLVWLEDRNAVYDASRLPVVRFWVFGCRKGRLLFQTAFISAIGFVSVIDFGYSSVSGGASLARTKYHLLAFPIRRWCCHLPFSSFFSSQHMPCKTSHTLSLS